MAILLFCGLSGAEAGFEGTGLVGKQIVRAQNINFSGEFRKYGNDPEDFDLGQLLREGHLVILSFFQNTCVPCRIEIPWLDSLAGKYRDQKVRVVLIDVSDSGVDRKRETDEFLSRMGIRNAHAYFDVAGNIRKNYAVVQGGVVAVPVLYVIGRDYRFKYARQGWVKAPDTEAYKKEFEEKLIVWLSEGRNLK